MIFHSDMPSSAGSLVTSPQTSELYLAIREDAAKKLEIPRVFRVFDEV
jgi:hypothetical protein